MIQCYRVDQDNNNNSNSSYNENKKVFTGGYCNNRYNANPCSISVMVSRILTITKETYSFISLSSF